MTGNRGVGGYDTEAGNHRVIPPSFLEPSLNRAERTPEVAAVSGVNRGSPGGEESSPGTPPTNLSRVATAVLDDTPTNKEKAYLNFLRLHYLEHIDKPQKVETKSLVPSTLKKCGLWAILGEDEDGNRIAKRIFCGKQWCELCGDIIHRRKTARCLPRVQQFETMGYWVIRPPWELMALLRTKQQRSCFVKKVKESFRAIAYLRGLTFIHDFGERSTKYAFHLNVLVDGGYLPPEVLDDLKRKLRRLIYPRSAIRRWGDKLDIFYEYRQTPAEMMHTLKYCTKATFLELAWDYALASKVHGARYSSWWGRWDESPKWQLDKSDKKLVSLVSLEQGNHPVSGKPIVWNRRPSPFVLVLMETPTELGNGYYLLSPIRPPPAGRRQPTNLIELPGSDYRKHPNAIRRSIDRHRELISRLCDCEPSE